MANIEIKKIDNSSQFEELRGNWGQLLAESPVKSAFLTWTWIYSWWETYGKDKKLWIISAWEDKKLVGLAPLMLETRKKGVARLRFLVNIGTPQSDAGGFLFTPQKKECVDTIVKYILQHESEWDILELNVLNTAGHECKSVIRLCNTEEVFLVEEQNSHFFVPLGEDWDTFSKHLSKNFTRNLRKASKYSEELGVVQLRHYNESLVTPDLVQELVEINRHSHFPRLYKTESEQKLLFKLIQNGSGQRNWLNVFILNINGTPVAYKYGFSFEGRFESWRSGFNTNLPQNISVGKLLTMKTIQVLIQENYQEIDFLRGDEPHKLEWKPEKKIYSNIRVFNRKKLQAVLSYQWIQRIKPIINYFKMKK